MERHVVKGLQRFGQFLQSERSRFAAAPVLLIQGKDAHRAAEATHGTACRHVEFLLSKQLGLRTIMSSHSCSDSVFATTHMVQEQHELVARTGATTVCAVGNQTAMDVAKAVVSSSQEEGCTNELILVPVTYEAILACAQPHSLLLDTVEDALLVAESSSLVSSSGQIPTSLALLEAHNVDTSGQVNALFASISLALDDLYQGRSSSRKNSTDSSAMTSRTISLLTKTVEILESVDDNNINTHNALVECLLLAGDVTSFGISMDDPGNRRSIPLGVAASLMPQVFPNDDILTVMASLVPALCDGVLSTRSTNRGEEEVSIMVEDLMARINALDKKPKSLVTTEPLGSVLSLIQGNRLLWNCFDAADDDYAQLLRNHVLL
jgi:hypothetical protein